MLVFHISFLQLDKVYNPQNAEDDMIEMEEERLRMREHVMNEVCFKGRARASPFIIQVLAITLVIRRRNKHAVAVSLDLFMCVSVCLCVRMCTCASLVPEKVRRRLLTSWNWN